MNIGGDEMMIEDLAEENNDLVCMLFDMVLQHCEDPEDYTRLDSGCIGINAQVMRFLISRGKLEGIGSNIGGRWVIARRP